MPRSKRRTPDASASLDHARLMIVHHGERELGLLVKDVVALLPANTSERVRFTMAGCQPMHMITAGAANQRKRYQVLDVATLSPPGSVRKKAGRFSGLFAVPPSRPGTAIFYVPALLFAKPVPTSKPACCEDGGFAIRRENRVPGRLLL